MKTIRHMTAAAALLAQLGAASAWAALPAPTPAQQQAAAAKKAQADAQAAKDKESLAASMDAVSSRWRSRAAQQGWKTHPPVAIAAAAQPPAAATGSVTAAGTAPQAAGQGKGPRELPSGLAAANPIVKSEKFGTAPPSEDHKAGPTKAEPRGTEPTVQKGSPETANKK